MTISMTMYHSTLRLRRACSRPSAVVAVSEMRASLRLSTRSRSGSSYSSCRRYAMLSGGKGERRSGETVGPIKRSQIDPIGDQHGVRRIASPVLEFVLRNRIGHLAGPHRAAGPAPRGTRPEGRATEAGGVSSRSAFGSAPLSPAEDFERPTRRPRQPVETVSAGLSATTTRRPPRHLGASRGSPRRVHHHQT